MPLEACMILLDNSEYMRNGDYVPTRLEAQQDAANLLVGAKTQSHPESTVGVSAGTELLVSPTEEVGKILSALHGLEMRDQENDVTAAVQVASLALKHRRNKNGAQRIVLFVGTPLTEVEPRALQKAGRQLKKNNVAIDVVALGELEVNEPKLRELVDAANGGRPADDGTQERTCHLVTIPAGVLPSDVLASSPILAGVGGAFAASAAAAAAASSGGGGGGGGGADNPFAEFGGVDPNMDPELAMALRVSMEEERARQERAAAAVATSSSSATSESKDAEMTDADGAAPASTSESAGATASDSAADMGLSEEEALLQQALAMSMNENDPNPEQQEDAKPAAMEAEEDQDEDAAMQMALQMSMQPEETAGEAKAAAEAGQQQQFQDPAFVNELLGSMPGVDPNDPEIQRALQQAQQAKKEQEKEDKTKKDEGKK